MIVELIKQNDVDYILDFKVNFEEDGIPRHGLASSFRFDPALLAKHGVDTCEQLPGYLWIDKLYTAAWALTILIEEKGYNKPPKEELTHE